MAWPDDGGRRGLPARDAGVLEDEEVEWAVTALFIQRLNSLGGEAEKCQREEDDYERYRSSFLPEYRTLLLLLSYHSLRHAPTDTVREGTERGRDRGRMLCPTHSSFSLAHADS